MRRLALLAGVILALPLASPALAQSQTQPQAKTQRPATRPQKSREPRWELEGYGGVSVGRASTDSPTLPSAGAPILTSSPIFPSRQVSSWFFGDGTALLNGVASEFGVAPRIVPLDASLVPLRSGSGAAAGMRLTRRLTDRLSAEFSVDTMLGSAGRADTLGAAINATRDSFKNTFAAVLATGPLSSITVDSTGTMNAGTRHDVMATVAFNYRLAPHAALSPYLTFGAGVMTGAGALPSASISGHYSFAILGQVPIDETDHVTLRYSRPATSVGVVGGGVRRDLSHRWAIRIDARVFVGADSTQLLLDATPSIVKGTPAGFVETFSNPALQFSNNSSTGRQSTLSESLQGFAVLGGGGLFTRALVTVGIVRRF